MDARSTRGIVLNFLYEQICLACTLPMASLLKIFLYNFFFIKKKYLDASGPVPVLVI